MTKSPFRQMQILAKILRLKAGDHMLQCQNLKSMMECSWLEHLEEEFDKPYFADLEKFLVNEWEKDTPIYPPKELIFNAFHKTPFNQVKVVIVGQDPYHGPRQAQGLSFSVSRGVPIPPSLRNIYAELRDDLGFDAPNHGSLEEWAKRGVLLLNATLTVRHKNPKSHFGKGWEIFTDAVLALLARRQDPIVFVLWGRSASDKYQSIKELADAKQHFVLTSTHPSPYSAHAGFLGSRPFSKVNALLEKVGKKGVDWQILPG